MLLVAAACLAERERPGPPEVTFSIDDPLVIGNRVDTVAGTVHVEDPDGIDSIWITLQSTEAGFDGGFNRVFDSPYRFVVQGLQQQQVPLVFRARDISGFEMQRDTYVVVLP